MQREETESNLEYVGLVLFSNSIKPATIPTLKQLAEAKILCIMSTGDNLDTAVEIGKQSGMLDANKPIIQACYLDGVISWVNLESQESISDIERYMDNNECAQIAINYDAYQHICK